MYNRVLLLLLLLLLLLSPCRVLCAGSGVRIGGIMVDDLLIIS